MKRHESLVPLSREHHEALILAKLIQVNAPHYKGLPTEPKEKAVYALTLFEEKLNEHFDVEEKMLAVLENDNGQLKRLTFEIAEEHKKIRNQFLNLPTSKSLMAHLNELGINLEEHIRKEERVLFPLIQDIASEQELEKIKSIVH